MAPTPTTARSSPEPCASPEPVVDDDVSVSASGNKDGHIMTDKEEGPSAECDNSEDAANREEEDAQNQGGEGESQSKEVHTTENEKEEGPSAECDNSEDVANKEEEDAQNRGGEGESQPKEVHTTENGKHIIIMGDGTPNTAPKANDEPESNAEEDGLISAEKSAQLPPPAWTDVTFDQLVYYPKSSLRAQSFFDIQQIRAIKPITLITMGISVPKFPDLENDDVVKLSIKQTKYQLYYPTDVLLVRKNKSYLQKEVFRRCILHNMDGMGEDATHNDIPKERLTRPKNEKLQKGALSRLPRPGHHSLAQCIEWLQTNPLPEEEHYFVLESAKQWRQQVRDQLGKVDSKSKELEAALADFDAEAKEQATVAKVDAAPINPKANTNDHLKTAFANYTNYLSTASNAKPVINYNSQMMPPNMMYQGQQFAAAVNINNIQAQMISHYQSQLAALQSQATTAPNNTQFEIFVSKDTFKFNAAHFVAYPGFRERLHGHNYRVSVKLIGSHSIGRDGYVLDFGCVKSVTKEVCKKMNEYFLVPTLSEVLKITVEEDEEGELEGGGKKICGECEDSAIKSPKAKKTKKRKRSKYPGSVTIVTEDGATFIFPKQDCLLLPIMHSTAEELGVYLYGKILQKLDSGYLHKRGVTAMEVTVSEAVGQDAVFRCDIPKSCEKEFDVASYISKEDIPVMPCATETEAAKQKKRNS